MRLKSTTWKGRNLQRINEIKEHYQGQANPLIVQVGVGGMASGVAPFYPEQRNGHFTMSQKLARMPLKWIDGGLRRIGLYGSLQQFETEDITNTLAELNPRLVAVDIDPRLLELVKNIPTIHCDITKQRKFILNNEVLSPDIIICYNTLSRTTNPEQALNNLEYCVGSKGYLSIDHVEPSNSFEKITQHLYRKKV